MTIKPTISITVGVMLLILMVFFTGVYRGTEFPSEVSSFIKYKPTLQFAFSDRAAGDNRAPSEEDLRQTQRYFDFVSHQPFNFSPFLAQSVMSFLTLGMTALRRKKAMHIGQVLIHFLCFIFFTVFGLGCILVYYDSPMVFLPLALLIGLNLLGAFLLSRDQYYNTTLA